MNKIESITTLSTKLSNRIVSISNDLRVLKESNKQDSKIGELETELATLKENEYILKKKIENFIYSIIREDSFFTTEISIMLTDFILIDGLTIIDDLELNKIVSFLGFKHYMVQSYVGRLTLYF